MKSVLLTDDDPDCQGIVKSLLENEGMTVQCAESGEEALGELRERTFDLLITDLNLPGLDGFGLSKKALEIAPYTPVIMITGDISPGIPRLAEEIGIKKVLFKPFNPTEILAAIRDVAMKQTGKQGRP